MPSRMFDPKKDLPNGGTLLLKVAEIPKLPSTKKKKDGGTYEIYACKFRLPATDELIERDLSKNDVTWTHNVGSEEVHLKDANEGDLWEAFESDVYKGRTYVNLRPAPAGSEPETRKSAASENRKSVKNEQEVSTQYNGTCFQCRCDSENCNAHRFQDVVKQRMISQAGFAQPALQSLLSRLTMDDKLSDDVLDAIVDQAIDIGARAASKNKERALRDLQSENKPHIEQEEAAKAPPPPAEDLDIPDEVPMSDAEIDNLPM